MTSDIKVGDVVQLKSGGTQMTVTQIGNKMYSDTPIVWCAWFEKNNKHEGDFPTEAVDAVLSQNQGPRIRAI